MTRYSFDEVRAALNEDWGLGLHRGGAMGDGKHDGRWDTTYSKTGYVAIGHFPGHGYSQQRFRSLAAVVRSCDLAKTLAKTRKKKQT